jgi:uncharacterized protein (DUF2236 family)
VAILSFPSADFTRPAGEPALVDPASVSWRIFKNPVALFAGGVAAVLLELAEPSVRTGVWEHTDFRRDPVRRLKRTGLAAMVTVYGARSVAERMIAGVVARHARVQGTTPAGKPYRANDPALLAWVQATAAFGFIEAYRRYVRPLTPTEADRAYAEGALAAALYGACDAPRSDAERRVLFEAMQPKLESSAIIFEFLAIMRDAPIVPSMLRPLQRLMIRAAVELVPDGVRERLGLGRTFGLSGWERRLVRFLGALADRVVLPGSPAVQSCLRLGLPAGHLYRRRGTG